MKRIPYLLSVGALLAAIGCTSPQPTSPLGPPPSPVLGTREPEPILPIPPPVIAEPTPPQIRDLPNVTIVVDAGHGGRDPGALGVGPQPEKVVVLAIAREIARQLEGRGARVVMTRADDRFLTLDARASVAEQRRAALFVSIHADAASRAEASGATVYISRSASPQSRRAGNAIAAALERAGIESRGVRTAGFRVLVAHSRPAVLIETGFLTNRREARLLADPTYQRRVATAIVEGIARYFNS